MIVVADEQILNLEQLLPKGIELIRMPAVEITHERLQHHRAEILLIRSVTRVNAQLLANTSVSKVGTMTSGIDHLDINWLADAGIQWVNAEGANALAVVEYVLCAIAGLQLQGFLSWQSVKVGVIGAGAIGARVIAALEKIGFNVIVHDPPRALKEAQPNLTHDSFISTPLSEFDDLDLICIHAALTDHGLFPSRHLLTHDFLQRQKPGCILLNVARGEIVSTELLLANPHLCLCLDVWEDEPKINLTLLQRATIATPHIAGYSALAKQRAVLNVCQQLWPNTIQNNLDEFLSSHFNSRPYIPNIKIDHTNHWQAPAFQAMNLFLHTATMRETLLTVCEKERGRQFEQLRLPFAHRKEFLDLSFIT